MPIVVVPSPWLEGPMSTDRPAPEAPRDAARLPNVDIDALPLNKVCELADFSVPEFRSFAQSAFPELVERLGPDFPAGFEYRKYWEVVMAARAFKFGGVLDPRAEVLGVGAGNEPTIFWLTNYVARVFATDLYLTKGWKESANASMLSNPDEHAHMPWQREHLVVQHMNALDLAYPDESFWGVFSSSSIEHFGGHDEVRRSVDEMWRVLRPGGVLSLSTELKIEGPGQGIPGTLLFSPDEILSLFIREADWEILGNVSFEASPSGDPVSFRRAALEVRKHSMRHHRLDYNELRWSTYPHIELEHKGYRWRSVHLALRKR